MKGFDTCQPLLINFLLCGWRDSNPHASRHQILSLACLPISPHPQVKTQSKRKRSCELGCKCRGKIKIFICFKVFLLSNYKYIKAMYRILLNQVVKPSKRFDINFIINSSSNINFFGSR